MGVAGERDYADLARKSRAHIELCHGMILISVPLILSRFRSEKKSLQVVLFVQKVWHMFGW